MKKRLFVVLNPTQYLNAVEYVNATGSEKDYLAIMSFHMDRFEVLNNLGAGKFWYKKSFLDFSKIFNLNNDNKFWNSSFSFLKDIHKRVLPDQLIVGNLIDNLIYPFVLSVKNRHPTIVNLDDGTPTLNIAYNRLKSTYYKNYHVQNFKSTFKKSIYLGLCPPLICPPKSIEFFTLFPLDLPLTDKKLTNNYKWSMSKVKPMPTTNEALFVGSHLVDRGIVHQNTYLSSLDYISKRAKAEGYKFVYVHHRGESSDIRDKLTALYPTIQYNLPLELAFIDSHRPAMFIGHFSSALFTLSRIYPNSKIKSYIFDDELILNTKFEPRDYTLRVQQALVNDNMTEVIRHRIH